MGQDPWLERTPSLFARLVLCRGAAEGLSDKPSWHSWFRGGRRSELVEPRSSVLGSVRRRGVPLAALQEAVTDEDALDAEREASERVAAVERAKGWAAAVFLACVWAAMCALALAFGMAAFSALGPSGAGGPLWQLWLVGFVLDAAAQTLRPAKALLAAALAACCGSDALLCRRGGGGSGGAGGVRWLERRVDTMSVQATLPVGRRLRWAERAAAYLHFTRRVRW